jgi:hypothetical protein
MSFKQKIDIPQKLWGGQEAASATSEAKMSKTFTR